MNDIDELQITQWQIIFAPCTDPEHLESHLSSDLSQMALQGTKAITNLSVIT